MTKTCPDCKATVLSSSQPDCRKPTPKDISRAIDAGIKACDLYELAKQDIISKGNLRTFLEAALEELK